MGAAFDDTLHPKESLIHLMIGTHVFRSSVLCHMSCKAPSIHSCSLICLESTGLDGHHVPPTSPFGPCRFFGLNRWGASLRLSPLVFLVPAPMVWGGLFMSCGCNLSPSKNQVGFLCLEPGQFDAPWLLESEPLKCGLPISL